MSRAIALVTGASRGIGKASAIALAEAGCDVAVAARTLTEGSGRDDSKPDGLDLPGGLDTTAAAVEAAGGRALPVVIDLLDAVREIENLTSTLSNKIWQKIMILDLQDAP